MLISRREMMVKGAACAASVTGLLKEGPCQKLSGEESIRRYLAARAAELEREFLPGITSAADFERIRPSLREDYFDMLGLNPMPERSPLRATITGRLERPDFRVEKLHFQSSPGLYVTANLYLPRPPSRRYPAILYQCGHYNHDRREGNKAAPDCQNHGIWFATHGYVAFVMDTLELSEIAGLHRGLLEEKRWWWHSAGYTPAGVECWNAMRAMDYLSSRPEVDASRIGATGISGGGIGTFWIVAADDRVRAAAPVSGMGDLTFYAGEDGISRHCDCFFLYNRARWNWTTICALACPRPLLFVNSDSDIYFPMPNNERIVARLERLYSRFGAGDKVDGVISVGGHGYRTDIRRAVFEFFNRYLRGDVRPVTDDSVGLRSDGAPEIEMKTLRVFPEDADFPPTRINSRIDEIFVASATPTLPTSGGFESWKQDLLQRLRKAAFAAWPAMPPVVYTSVTGSDPREGSESTEDGIDVYWKWLPGKAPSETHWLIVLEPGEDPARLPAWARTLVSGNSALLLSTRGIGRGAWKLDEFPHPVERAAALLGGTVDGGRVWDIMTVAGRRSWQGIHWHAAGQGNSGILAAYAALYQPVIEAVTAVNPPKSHRPKSAGEGYGPALLNVLRVFDIPEALGCLAPRPLRLIGAEDPVFKRVAQIYRLAGAADRLA